MASRFTRDGHVYPAVRSQERKEVLFNVAHIAKIEIYYGIGGGEQFWKTSLTEGHLKPDTQRFYRVHIAGEEIFLMADPNDAVVKVFEEIYKDAIKS